MKRSWRSVQTGAIGILVVAFVAAVLLIIHFVSSRPTSPDPQHGRVVELPYGREVYYLTANEALAYKLCFGVSALCFIIAVAIEETARRHKAKL